jgi:hypothetical protein
MTSCTSKATAYSALGMGIQDSNFPNGFHSSNRMQYSGSQLQCGSQFANKCKGAPIIGSWLAPDYEVGEAPDQLSTLLYISIHITDTTLTCMSILLSMYVHMAI